MSRPCSVTYIGKVKIRLFKLRHKEVTPYGDRIDADADAVTLGGDGVLTVLVREHCFKYRRRLLHLLIHEAIHCIEEIDGLIDIESPKDCTRAATALSLGVSQFLENLPRDWKKAAGLI